MREPNLRFPFGVAALSHPLQMRRERLADGLVIVKRANLAAHELNRPDGNRVCASARAPDVEKQPIRKQRIGRDLADTPSEPSVVERLGVVRALQHTNITTFQDVVVLLWLLPQAVLTFELEFRRPEWVVSPICANQYGARWHVCAKQGLNRVGFLAWVP